MIAPMLSLLIGCSEGPLFENITGIEIQAVSPNGLKRTHLEQTGLRQGIDCLYTTSPTDQATTQKRQLLQTAYLILVRDAAGVRNFEMITDMHMKGNKDRYYENRCILQVIEQYGPK